jgi:protein-tyrosine phosphatase
VIVRLLFVCTGNRCRSPLAERLSALWAEEALGAAGEVVTSSAGTDAAAGEPMEERSAQALSELGGDPRDVVSRALDVADLEAADLVLTMTRQHRRRVLELVPRAMRRTFTLAEAAALLAIDDPATLAVVPVADRTRGLATLLDGARASRAGGPEDDIPDPIGQPQDVHRSVAARIVRDLRPLADALFAPLGDRGPGTAGQAVGPMCTAATPPVVAD